MNLTPMLKKLPVITPLADEVKFSPSTLTLNTILNYSKSIEVYKLKKKKALIHMN